MPEIDKSVEIRLYGNRRLRRLALIIVPSMLINTHVIEVSTVLRPPLDVTLHLQIHARCLPDDDRCPRHPCRIREVTNWRARRVLFRLFCLQSILACFLFVCSIYVKTNIITSPWFSQIPAESWQRIGRTIPMITYVRNTMQYFLDRLY